MSDLPEIKVDQLITAVTNIEISGPFKSFQHLCVKIANGSWAEFNDLDEDMIGELITHHKVATKTLQPGQSAPVRSNVETTVQASTVKILAPVDAAMIKTYTEGGRGKKQCPSCKNYIGAKSAMCACGHAFATAKKPATVMATVAADDYEPEMNEESSQVSAVRRSSGGGVSTPHGSCPSSLSGTDLASVKKWAEAVRKHYSAKNQFLTVEGLRYFAREFYNIHSPEFQQVKLRLLELHGNED